MFAYPVTASAARAGLLVRDRKGALSAGGALLRLALFLGALLVAAAPRAETRPAVAPLLELLRLDDIIKVMRIEGITYATELESEFFPGRGGDRWQATVAMLYAPQNLRESFHRRFAAEMEGRDMGPMVEFFASPLGRKVIGLEISARRALLDDAVEETAREALMQMRAGRDPRLDLLAAFIETNDLIEYNVTGALNSNLAFYRGLERGGAFPEGMSEERMLAEVWAQEPEIRSDTEEWLYLYMAMAYQPLDDAELKAYIEFSGTPAGRQLNAALFRAFGDMFDDLSLALGLAAAERLRGDDL